MNILVLGSGGREHALCWAIKKSKLCNNIYCIPGNSGIQDDVKCFDIDPRNKEKILRFCQNRKIDLVVIGPEDLLEIGISDFLISKKILVFGPSKKGAKLETSKSFAKKFLERNNIPTSSFKEFSKLQESQKYIDISHPPYVIKVDGLASGKGVYICNTKQLALASLQKIFIEKKFGSSGKKIVIEEFLEGFEMSFFTFIDSKSSLNLGYALDHKRLLDSDKGPNTGGMGAFSPSKIVSKTLLHEIQEKIINPTIKGIKNEKLNFRGVLFFGIMVTKTGPKVIEYNVRFGDPECQSILFRIESDLLDILISTAKDTLNKSKIIMSNDFSICVVLSSKGYPESFKKNQKIENLHKVKNKINLKVFHAATTKKNGEYFSNGGRVLSVTSKHKNYNTAIKNAYECLREIDWKLGYYRKDIGKKNIN